MNLAEFGFECLLCFLCKIVGTFSFYAFFACDGKMKMMSLLRMTNLTMNDACVLVMREGTSTCCMDSCFA